MCLAETNSGSASVARMRAWLNGRLLDPVDQPALSITDHGITVGDGAFETVQIVEGEPFALTRHLERWSVRSPASAYVHLMRT